MQSNTGPQDPLFIDVNNVALSRGPQDPLFIDVNNVALSRGPQDPLFIDVNNVALSRGYFNQIIFNMYTSCCGCSTNLKRMATIHREVITNPC
jgi:hypothetical protein